MATSYNIVLKNEKINDKGECPLYLRITENRKSSYKALGVLVSPELWDGPKQRVKSKYPNSARVNNFLAHELAVVQGNALDMVAANVEISAKRIKKSLAKQSSRSFIAYFEAYIEQLVLSQNIGSYKRSSTTLSKLKHYLQNKDVLFTDIDVDFLKAYERYLKTELGNGTNTVHSNLKLFRMLFNLAFREGIITADQNPFLRYRLKLEKTSRDYITEDELKRIEDLVINESYVMNHHRWMYVFACYAGGLRISDLLQLRWRNFTGTHIVITIHKTKDQISINLPNRALEILEFYKPITGTEPDAFIFPFLDKLVDYTDKRILFNAISSNTAYANKNLKKLATMADINKEISFHTSRHTFATRALRKGIRMEYVSKLMGHASLKTTQVYAKIVDEELDKAMQVFN
ncbi:Tsr0667 family tyrosine-type DNA invertase [Spirosoma flavus]